MKRTLYCVAILSGLMLAQTAQAQGPQQPGEEHKILKAELGTWKADMKIWMPGADEPMMASGEEVNEMFGEFWVVSKFKANMMGQPFEGRASMGYDPVKKKYVGTWFDTMTPHMSFMEGTYDKDSKTLTMMTTGIGMDGKPSKGKNVVVTKDDGSRVFTMYQQMPNSDEMHKGMEIIYTKK